MKDCPDCFCLEKNFGVSQNEEGIWEVYDAECEIVAVCEKETFANAIMVALNAFEDIQDPEDSAIIYAYCKKHR